MDPKSRISLPMMGTSQSPPDPAASELPPDAPLQERVWAALRTIYDPEIPVNIADLGLIYDLKIEETGAVAIRMTLTTPACPVAGALPRQVEERVLAVAGVSSAKAELVWDPPWTPSRMTEEAQLTLGLF
jgi:FeS assembly SUF system protein